MTFEYFCLRCETEIYFDETEHQWCCECFATRTEPDEDGMPNLAFIPEYWLLLNRCSVCGQSSLLTEFGQDELLARIIRAVIDSDERLATELLSHIRPSTLNGLGIAADILARLCRQVFHNGALDNPQGGL